MKNDEKCCQLSLLLELANKSCISVSSCHLPVTAVVFVDGPVRCSLQAASCSCSCVCCGWQWPWQLLCWHQAGGRQEPHQALCTHSSTLAIFSHSFHSSTLSLTHSFSLSLIVRIRAETWCMESRLVSILLLS